MKNICILLLFIIPNILIAQTSNELFTNANTLYKTGNYKEAIHTYKQILAKKKASSEIYYNIANCYYKLNEVAPSIYNYEKSLQLDPTNNNALTNLKFAKRLTLDRIEGLPKTIFQKFNTTYLQKLSYNQWASLSIVFSLIASLFFIFYYFASRPSKKRLYFALSIFSVILLLGSFSISFHQYNKKISNIKAIVYTEEISIKNEPIKKAEEIFTLHEGTKITILDTVDNWKKIKIADGKIGWTLAKNLKEL